MERAKAYTFIRDEKLFEVVSRKTYNCDPALYILCHRKSDIALQDVCFLVVDPISFAPIVFAPARGTVSGPGRIKYHISGFGRSHSAKNFR